jgi:hypothetical protein
MTLAEAEAILRGISSYAWLFQGDVEYETFYRASKVAQMVGIDSQTVNRWCNEGQITNVLDLGGKLGYRIPRDSLVMFFAQRVKHPQSWKTGEIT